MSKQYHDDWPSIVQSIIQSYLSMTKYYRNTQLLNYTKKILQRVIQKAGFKDFASSVVHISGAVLMHDFLI